MVRRPFIIDGRQSTARGLVGLWGPGPAGGGTLFDMSGRVNHGTLTNGPTWVADGERGWVLDLDGDNDKVVCSPVAASGSGSGLTVMAWMYCRSQAEDTRAISRGSAFDDAEIILLWGDDVCADGDQGVGNTDTFMFNYGSTIVGGNRVNGTTGLRALNQWQHVCGVMNGAGRLLYVDGTLNASHSGATQTALVSPADNLWIGDWEFASLPANMQIPGLRVYNRALSAAEVQRIYQKTWAEPYSDIAMPSRRVSKAPAAAGFVPYPYPRHELTGGLAT